MVSPSLVSLAVNKEAIDWKNEANPSPAPQLEVLKNVKVQSLKLQTSLMLAYTHGLEWVWSKKHNYYVQLI